MSYSWTQPCCRECWDERNPGRQPVVVIDSEAEVCVYCRTTTRAGIYVRIDPAEAPHPTREKLRD